jgi:ATP-dependent helicase HepA
MNKSVQRRLFSGQFVSSSANSYGVGSLVDVQGNDVVIRYFDSPAVGSEVVETVPADTVRHVQLDPQSRVYFREPETVEWLVGRVLDYVAEDRKYLVQFPNGDRRIILESGLQTRWLKPLADPTDQLAFALNETAYWHAGREKFLTSLYNQRRACCGMTAILSSAIDIETHQVATVRRVLQDSLQRYLLADEVGLGKTIEAGILIRQYVLDEPTAHRVLIIVPTPLLTQWREELRTRFFLEDQLGHTIQLVALEDQEGIDRFGKDAGMIVIDEAHHLAARAWSFVEEDAKVYASVAGITRPLHRKLLLLSATPALHNERGFLAMLHLLDPAMYSLDDLNAFQERVRQRQRIAEVLSALQLDEPNHFMRQAVEDIAELAPEDLYLSGLARDLAKYLEEDPDEDDPRRNQLVTQLRFHISETWRLHRRILRTRRSKDSQVLLPGRDGARVHFWSCPDHILLNDAFHEWRLTIAQVDSAACKRANLEQLVQVMAESIVCDPSVVQLLVSARLGNMVDLDGLALFPDQRKTLCEVPVVDGESEMLTRLCNIATNLDLRSFNATLLAVIEAEMATARAKGISVILFANYPETADRLFRMLQRRFGQQQTFRHSPTSTKWLQALSGGGSRVLVCDRRAEEGLNLQGRHTVFVHTDLPLSPNRVEQRIGRVDRFGSGQGIRSIILLTEHSELQKVWFQTLDAALQVFNRSVASLQYVIEAEFSRGWTDFVDSGCEALQDMLARLSGPTGRIEAELKRVSSQSDLDSFDYDPKRDVQFVDELLRLDIKSAALRDAADGWIKSRLHFDWRGENDPKDSVFRYQFCRRNDSRSHSRVNDTLLSLADFNRSLHHSFEMAEDSPVEVLYESVPLTFDRQISQRRFARLARVGDQLIDTFADLLNVDSRGVAFAMWRYRPDLEYLDSPAELAFRFDFVVEANAAPALQVLETGQSATHTAVRRTLDSCFQPRVATIWLDSNLRTIQDGNRLDVLARSYNADWNYINATRVRDFNLNRDRWSVVRRWWDAEHWVSLCRQARIVAEETLKTAHELQSVCEASARICREQARIRCQSLESRRALSSAKTAEQMSREIEFEKTLAAAMEQGIQHPCLRLDSVGAVFLSNQNPFAGIPAFDNPRSRSHFDE